MQVCADARALPCLLRVCCRDADDAMCAVCGEGHSEAPNQILFCERCDVPVHQVGGCGVGCARLWRSGPAILCCTCHARCDVDSMAGCCMHTCAQSSLVVCAAHPT